MHLNYLILLLFTAFILTWVLIILGIVLSKHYRGKEQIFLYNSLSKEKSDTVFSNVKMKFSWSNGYKSYISFVNYCDIYLADKYIVIMPFQTFPFKAYNEPVLLTGNIIDLKPDLCFIKQYTPDKITFKKVIKGEVEIVYHQNNEKYFITLKDLKAEEKQKLELIKEWSS